MELILGHRAVIRENKTQEGFTHDWEVYVKSDQGPIQAFVDRVIFHIHESFPKPRRGERDFYVASTQTLDQLFNLVLSNFSCERATLRCEGVRLRRFYVKHRGIMINIKCEILSTFAFMT